MLGLASQNRGKTTGENAAAYGKIAGAAALTYASGGAAAPLLINSVGELGNAPGAGTGYNAPQYGNRLWGNSGTGGQAFPNVQIPEQEYQPAGGPFNLSGR